MKWLDGNGRTDYEARCGHLYLRIECHEAYKTPDHPDYAPEEFEWFIEPDDDDKSYRRALRTATSDTLDMAKDSVIAACKVIIAQMQADL